MLLDQGRREVVVEDVVAGQVCCRWIENGTARKAWIPAERLQPMVPPDRMVVIS